MNNGFKQIAGKKKLGYIFLGVKGMWDQKNIFVKLIKLPQGLY